ncbi:DUF6479 family protein [Streptomyces sp. NPDC052811]|uniref:DUF6479 family protein n=1 Tax=Streptomyces sp. NPDC052811 TaxID=3155731 RepID=UPI00342C4B49
MSTFVSSQTLAANTSAAWLFVIVGVAVVAVLIAAFWYGARRAARMTAPSQEPQARSESWHNPDPSETHHDTHPEDHK